MRRHAPPRYYHTRVKRSVTGLYDTWLKPESLKQEATN